MESSEIWFELGNTCSEMGLLDKAVQAYLKAIEQKLPSGCLYTNLAAIYVKQGKFFDALPLYQKSLEFITNPKDISVTWGRIGNTYHQLNEYGKSIQAFQKADEFVSPKTTREPVPNYIKDAVPYENTLDIFGTMGNQFYIAGLENEPTLATPLFGSEETSDCVNALDVPEPEVSNKDITYQNQFLEENANVWNELGLILFKVGAYDDAIDAYQKAIALEPDAGYLYSNLGQVYVIQGKLAESIDNFEKSIKLLTNNKDKAVSWTRLGDIYRQLEQNDRAIPAYQLADVLNQSIANYTNEYRLVNIDLIISNRSQVRGLEDIGDLVLSIRRHGIIQPLIVSHGRNEPGKYILIAGQRRLEAARMVGLKEVPVIIRRATNQEIHELSINENIHSAALNPFELATEYRILANEFELTIEEISEITGRSCHSVANTLKILELPNPAKPTAGDKEFTSGQMIINQSLEDIYIDNLGSQTSQHEGIATSLSQNDESQIGINKPSTKITDDTSSTLWYLNSEKEALIAPQGDDIYPEDSSLLTRARDILKSNPHPKRVLAASSYGA